MNQNKLTKKVIEDMAGGFLFLDKIEESPSCISNNPFRAILKTDVMNIGNLEALKGRGFELLCFGVNDEGRLFIDFDVASPKVRA